jgi:hypothetical protein
VKRTAAVLAALVLCLSFAACGGDDDDDEGGVASSPTTEAAEAGDFCELWPALNDDQTDFSSEKPTEEQIAEARRLLADARASAPDEIGKEVDQLGEALEGVLDDLESGTELDPEAMFGELFGLAFSAGPPIEQWLVDNCPGYESDAGFEDDGTGALGIADDDLDAMVTDIIGDTQGSDSSSGLGSFEWTIYTNDDVDAALAHCEELSSALADHADGSGELQLTIGDADGEPIAVNAAITPGDAGSCEAA